MDNSYFQSERRTLSQIISQTLMSLYSKEPVIQSIIDEVLNGAANAACDAGYSGSHSDGGARAKVQALETFLVGYHFAKTGQIMGSYQTIVKNYQNKLDPEYQKYLDLKNKFEG